MSLTQQAINAIVALAASSDLAKYSWPGRGRAPIGYTKGMAVCFGQTYAKLLAGDSAARAMVAVVDGPYDVFDHYDQQFADIRMETDGASDADRLRALFVILTGLGMRESSGRYCEGRDRSASNTTADTAEAGLFQQSWDSRRANPEIEKMFRSYSKDSRGFLDIFKEGVLVKPGDLDNYGSGDGREFQFLCKLCPEFAVEVAAIGLRTLYTHWGPIVRHEAELVPAANALFKQVQAIVDAQPGAATAGKPAQPSTQQVGWFSQLMSAIVAMFRRVPARPPAVPVPAGPVLAAGTPWMTWAAKEIGFHETGTNRNIGRYTGPAKCGSEGDPWCAIFVNAALESNGIRGTRSAMARSFENDSNFVKLIAPAYGAIVTMWRGSPQSGSGHCFFYVGENERGILALGGNQSDHVCRQYEPRNRVVGYWWPKSRPLPSVGKIIVKDSGSTEGSET